MKLLTIILFVGLVSTSFGDPEASVSLRQRRDVDILANTRHLIKQLIENLANAAQQARDAIGTFIAGIQQQVQLFRQKVIDDIQNLRNGIRLYITNIIDKINGTGPAVRACIEKQQAAAEQIFSVAHENSNKCASLYVEDIQVMVNTLGSLADGAINYTRTIGDQMENCSKGGAGLFNVGTCLGGLMVKTEYKGVSFAAQSAVMISKINLSLLTMPAALEVCAGRSLLSAGSEARSIMSEIASCSYSTIFTFNEVSNDLNVQTVNEASNDLNVQTVNELN